MLELLASEARAHLQDVLALGICLAAFLWGGQPERAIAAIWFLIMEVPLWLHSYMLRASFQLTEIDLFLAGSDVVAGILWIAVALNANRNYPLWIAALQVLAITAHLARGVTDLISPVTYTVMITLPGWMQLFILAGGLARHKLRQREYGSYRDWRVPVRWFGLLPAQRERI